MLRNRRMFVLVQILGCLGVIAIVWAYPGNAWKFITAPEEGFSPGIWLSRIALAAGVIASIAVLAVVICNAFVTAKHDTFLATKAKEEPEAPPPISPIEQRAAQIVTNDNMREFDAVTWTAPDGSAQTFRVFAEDSQPDDTEIKFRTVKLLEPTEDGKYAEVEFGYAVLSDSFSWLKGSERKFKGTSGKGINIETALKQSAYIQSGVREAPRIICIGLASAELSSMSQEDNENLSDARAMNLGLALLDLKFADEKRQYVQGLGGGYAQQKPDEVADPDLQRAAIIIAVHHSQKKFDVPQFVLAINKLVAVKKINLEKYSRQPEHFRRTVRLSWKGQYASYKSLKDGGKADEDFIPITPRAGSTEAPDQ